MTFYRITRLRSADNGARYVDWEGFTDTMVKAQRICDQQARRLFDETLVWRNRASALKVAYVGSTTYGPNPTWYEIRVEYTFEPAKEEPTEEEKVLATKRKLTAAQKENDGLHKENADLIEENGTLIEENDDLQKEIDQLKKDLERTWTIAKDSVQSEKELLRTQKENACLKRQLEHMRETAQYWIDQCHVASLANFLRRR